MTAFLATRRPSRRMVVALTLATLLVVVGLGWLALDKPTSKPVPVRPHATTANWDCTSGPYHATTSITVGTVTGPCSGDGIVVDANSITINLNGKTLTGSGGDAGVHEDGHSGVTITNGSVTNFFSGILVSGGSSNKITAIRSFSNGSNGMVVQSPGSSVTSSATFLNNADGIYVNANKEVLTSNTSRQNSVMGIRVVSGVTGAVLTGNKVLNNAQDGINDSGSGTQLTSNITNINGADGIESGADETAALKSNTANYNTFAGIHAHAGATDGGGNAAKNNGTFQCDNVVCA
jgi:hypothetical protein